MSLSSDNKLPHKQDFNLYINLYIISNLIIKFLYGFTYYNYDLRILLYQLDSFK